MPKPLRSSLHALGLPDLNPCDRAANHMLHGAIKCIRRCLVLGIAGYLENPQRSWLWKTTSIQRLLQSPSVQLVKFDQCQYGTPCKKPTFLLIWNCAPVQFLTCSGKRGLCGRTGKAYLQHFWKKVPYWASTSVFPRSFQTLDADFETITTPKPHPPVSHLWAWGWGQSLKTLGGWRSLLLFWQLRWSSSESFLERCWRTRHTDQGVWTPTMS